MGARPQGTGQRRHSSQAAGFPQGGRHWRGGLAHDRSSAGRFEAGGNGTAQAGLLSERHPSVDFRGSGRRRGVWRMDVVLPAQAGDRRHARRRVRAVQFARDLRGRVARGSLFLWRPGRTGGGTVERLGPEGDASLDRMGSGMGPRSQDARLLQDGRSRHAGPTGNRRSSAPRKSGEKALESRTKFSRPKSAAIAGRRSTSKGSPRFCSNPTPAWCARAVPCRSVWAVNTRELGVKFILSRMRRARSSTGRWRTFI